MLFIVAITIAFISCQKDNLMTINKLDLMVFESQEDFQRAIEEISSLNIDEIIKHEDLTGFISFGRKCDEFYRTVDQKNFNSMEEFKSFVNDNSDFIQLFFDDNGELELETKFHDRLDKYFLNDKQIYQIGNNIYRAFDSGTVVSTIDNYEELSKTSNEIGYYANINDYKVLLDNKEINLKKSVQTDFCGDYFPFVTQNGNYRMTGYLKITANKHNWVEWSVYFKNQEKGWLGIWSKVSMECKVNLESRLRYKVWLSSAYTQRYDEDFNFIFDSKAEEVRNYTRIYGDIADESGDDYHHFSYHPLFYRYSISYSNTKIGEVSSGCNNQ